MYFRNIPLAEKGTAMPRGKQFLIAVSSRFPVAVREDIRPIVLSCNLPALQVVCHHYGAEIDHIQS
jgi:hypothetical protein